MTNIRQKIYGPIELARMYSGNPNMQLVIHSLWREYYGLYTEKYKKLKDIDELGNPIDPWLLNKISDEISYGLGIGQDHDIAGNRSFAFGQGGVTKSFMEIVLGAYNLIPEGQNPTEWIPTDLLLTLGNGPDKDHRSNVFEIYKNGLFKFLQAIVIGTYPALPEGQYPKAGAIQFTPEKGFEKWNDETKEWEAFGGSSDEKVRLMSKEFEKTSPAGFLHDEYFTATTYPESGKTLIIPNISKIHGNAVNNYYDITIDGQSEFALPYKANKSSIRVYRNLSRLYPTKYTVSNGIVTVLLPLLAGETIRIKFDIWKDDKWIYNEIPTGLIDDINQEFYLAEEPNPDLLELSKNGELMQRWQYAVDGKKITTLIETKENDRLLADYPTSINPGKIYNETPTGLIDGINKIFTLGRSPTPGTVRHYHNGKRQHIGEEITITDDQIEFAIAPEENDELLTDYDFT